MASSLHSRLNVLASAFATSVLDAIRGSSLHELLAQSGNRGRGALRTAMHESGGREQRRSGRLPRRSTKDIKGMVEQIVTLLRHHPKGLRAEQIRKELGLQAKELPRPLKEGLDAGRFHKAGQKRATTYSVRAAAKGGSRSTHRGSRKGGASGQKGGGRRAKRARAPEQKETVTTNSVEEPSS